MTIGIKLCISAMNAQLRIFAGSGAERDLQSLGIGKFALAAQCRAASPNTNSSLAAVLTSRVDDRLQDLMFAQSAISDQDLIHRQTLLHHDRRIENARPD